MSIYTYFFWWIQIFHLQHAEKSKSLLISNKLKFIAKEKSNSHSLSSSGEIMFKFYIQNTGDMPSSLIILALYTSLYMNPQISHLSDYFPVSSFNALTRTFPIATLSKFEFEVLLEALFWPVTLKLWSVPDSGSSTGTQKNAVYRQIERAIYHKTMQQENALIPFIIFCFTHSLQPKKAQISYYTKLKCRHFSLF